MKEKSTERIPEENERLMTISKGRQLYYILKKQLEDNHYHDGEKLPSIRNLAQQYGVSCNTVNTVIAMLSADHLVNIQTGKGVYVGSGEQEIRLIGVMLLDFSTGLRVENDILKHIQRNLPINYRLSLVSTANRYDIFCSGLRQLIETRISGFLIVPPKGKASKKELKEAQQLISSRPVVMINRTITGLNADMYSMDLRKGIEKAFEYLATSGKQHVSMLLHDDPKFSQEELEAYTECCQMYGIEPHADWLIDLNDGMEVIRTKIQNILPQIDTLIGPDRILFELSDLIQQCGKEIPKELSLIGINDTLYARMFNPPLTSIAFPSERIGRHAIHKLIKRIEGTADSIKSVNFEPELIIRNS